MQISFLKNYETLFPLIITDEPKIPLPTDQFNPVGGTNNPLTSAFSLQPGEGDILLFFESRAHSVTLLK